MLLVSHDRTLIEQSCNRFWLIDKQRLEEWHHLEPVYAILADKPASVSVPASTFEPESIMLVESEEEQLLAELLELESKLKQDLAHKFKHQKPELQCQWRQQIAQLNALLDLM